MFVGDKQMHTLRVASFFLFFFVAYAKSPNVFAELQVVQERFLPEIFSDPQSLTSHS